MAGRLSVCLSVCLSVRLPVCLSVFSQHVESEKIEAIVTNCDARTETLARV